MARNKSEKRTPLQICAAMWVVWVSSWGNTGRGLVVESWVEDERYNAYCREADLLSSMDMELWGAMNHAERRMLHAS